MFRKVLRGEEIWDYFGRDRKKRDFLNEGEMGE